MSDCVSVFLTSCVLLLAVCLRAVSPKELSSFAGPLLSTNLTSLNVNEERLSIVVEMVMGGDGSLQESDVYRARVRNHAKLAYTLVRWSE